MVSLNNRGGKLLKTFNNILVATDTRLKVHPIVDEAAQIAHRNGAALKLVDVVPEFPWIARMMVSDHETMRQLIGREKLEKLEVLASSYRDEGLDVETKVLWGKTSVEIIREVLREQHDLVLRVAKGHGSSRKGFFGTTGRRLLRDCPCAVWLVAAADTPEYKHVMACIDTSTGHELDAELNRKVFESASLVSEQHNADLSIMHAWSMDAEKLLEERLSREDFEGLLEQRRTYVEDLLNKFLKGHGIPAGADNVHFIKVEATLGILTFAREKNVDLVVMGTVARSGLTGMMIGNTAERILDDLQCSLLALKPDSFVSPITQSQYINPATTDMNS